MSRLLIVGALAALTPGCASSSGSISKQDRLERLLDVAAAAITENDPISALETLNQVRDADNSIPREHYLYALAFLKKNESALAEASARKAIQLDPDYSLAKNTLGKILLDRGRLQEAESVLKAAATDLMFREAYLAKTNLGILYYKKMDTKSAEIWFQRAVTDNGPTTCIALYHLGRIQLERNELGAALRNFTQSSREGCGALTETHFAIGQTLLRQKKYNLARSKFIEIQRLFPEGEPFEKAAEIIKGIP